MKKEANYFIMYIIGLISAAILAKIVKTTEDFYSVVVFFLVLIFWKKLMED